MDNRNCVSFNTLAIIKNFSFVVFIIDDLWQNIWIYLNPSACAGGLSSSTYIFDKVQFWMLRWPLQYNTFVDSRPSLGNAWDLCLAKRFISSLVWASWQMKPGCWLVSGSCTGILIPLTLTRALGPVGAKKFIMVFSASQTICLTGYGPNTHSCSQFLYRAGLPVFQCC